jgi:hypothetical protein
MNRNSSFRLSLLASVNNAKIKIMKNAARIVLLGASALLLTSCGDKKQSSLPSFDYSSFCLVDSPFSFEAGTTLSDYEAKFSDLRVQYAKTTDTAVSTSKAYYVLANGIYERVLTPKTSDLSTYYERGSLNDILAIFSTAGTADIYPNKMDYSYVDKVDYGTAGVLDWYDSTTLFDHTTTRTKTLSRYEATDSLLVDGPVAYAEDSYQDFDHNGTKSIVKQAKSGVSQLTRDGYCDFTNKITLAFSFDQGKKIVGGTARTVDLSSYNYYVGHSYSHDLYQTSLRLADSSAIGSSFQQLFNAVSKYDDASGIAALPTSDGSYYSLNAISTDDSGTKGITVSFKSIKASTNDQNTTVTTDDEVNRYGTEFNFVTKGPSIVSYSSREYTSSQIGTGAERILTETVERASYSRDASLSSFTGTKVDASHFRAAHSEDFTF